jgi:hypothetical protein
MQGRLVTVVTSIAMPTGRCRYCGRSIFWATTASRPGHPSKTLPFDLPRPWPLRTERNDDTGLAFEIWPSSSLHFTTCPSRQARSFRPAVQRRMVRA